MKKVTVDQIFPKNVINQIENFAGKSVNEIEIKLIQPNLKAINEFSGQENDSKYLAYLVQHLLIVCGFGSKE